MGAFKFAAEVAEYISECRALRLQRKYHPTADGAVKMIYHRTPADADRIRAAFAAHMAKERK